MVKQKKKSLTRALLVALGIPSIFLPGLILASILGWDWQQDLERLVRSGGYKQSREIFPKEVLVKKVWDGDTFEIESGQSVRMIGIDAPDQDEAGASEATEYLKDLIEDERIELEYDSYKDDKYGRLLAYVWESCQTSLGCSGGKRLVNWLMIKKKLAVFLNYEDRGKLKYEDLLKSAE